MGDGRKIRVAAVVWQGDTVCPLPVGLKGTLPESGDQMKAALARSPGQGPGRDGS